MDEPWTDRTLPARDEIRRPAAVPDLVASGTDTDGDGVPDTLLTVDEPDLLVQTDLDTDGLVDRVVRIGLDGAVHTEPSADPVGGVRGGWPGLLDGIFGPGT